MPNHAENIETRIEAMLDEVFGVESESVKRTELQATLRAFANHKLAAETDEQEQEQQETNEVPRCAHCGKTWPYNVLCPECEQLCCLVCGRVVCCCSAV